MIEIVPVRAIVRAFNIVVKLRWLKRRIIAEVAGSSPATATKINSKKDRIMKQNHLSEDGEMRYILRHIGFGAVLGIAFLAVVYLGGLIAHLVSGM